MKPELLDALTEYIMLVTLRAAQLGGDPSKPSEREKELYAQITAAEVTPLS